MKMIDHYIVPFFKLWYHFSLRIAVNEMLFVINRKRHPLSYGKELPTIHKYYNLISYIGKEYKYIIDKYIGIDHETWNGELVTDDCPIWVFWAQGFENAPDIVQTCLKSIKLHAGNHPVIELDSTNVLQYIDFSSDITEKFQKGVFTPSLYSDLIRFKLLERHGGIWLDACDMFLNDSFFSEATKYHFYSVKGFDNQVSITRSLWSDGIIACGKNNMYPQMMAELLTAYCEKENYLIDYFISSCFQNAAYVRILNLRRMFDEYPFNNVSFFEIRKRISTEFNPTLFAEFVKDTSIFNLTWKKPINNSVKTYYHYILESFSQNEAK